MTNPIVLEHYEPEHDKRIKKLEELQRICDSATPGPWTVAEAEGYYYLRCPIKYSMRTQEKENYEFISIARTEMPRLIAESRRLNKLMEWMEEQYLSPGSPLYLHNGIKKQIE